MREFQILLAAILVIYVGYAVIPTLLSRLFRIGVCPKSDSKLQYALTFDDGPDPVYTPRLLELLKVNGIQATFFVLGEKAEKHPELIHRMHREGHLIGIHHYHHTANWLLLPAQVRRRINRTAAIIERITGERPVYYRPPWGLVTWTDWAMHRHHQVRVVLWSLMVSDWLGKRKLSTNQRKLISDLHDGSIIVLHDSGETFGAVKDAPKYMLQGLQHFLQETHSKGYTCVRMDQLLDSQHQTVS